MAPVIKQYYKYDARTDAFSNIPDLPHIYHRRDAMYYDESLKSLQYDAKQNVLFLYYNNRMDECDALNVINLSTKTHKVIDRFFPERNFFVATDDSFHIFDNHNEEHWIYSFTNNNNQFKISTVNSHSVFPQDPPPYRGGQAIYVPSRQCIVLIGGSVASSA